VTLAILTTLFWAAPALAKKAPEGANPKFRPTPALEARPGGMPLSSIYDEETGTVTRMYQIKARYAGTPEEAAKAFLADNTALFGFQAKASDLEVVSVKESPSGTHVRFQQTVGGIPVYRGDVLVNLNRQGEISSVSNDYRPGFTAPTRANLSAEQAYDIAYREAGINGRLMGEPTKKLLVFPKGDQGYLAYRVTIPAENPLGDWEVFVDAVTGDVLQVIDQTCYVQGTGKTFDPDPESTMNNPNLPDNNDSDAGIPAESYFTYTLNDLNPAVGGLYRLEGPWCEMIDFESPVIAPPAIADPNAFIWTRNPDQFENVVCYWHIDNTQRWFQSLGIMNANALPQEIDAHGLNGADNSHFIPSTHRIAYGDGGVDDAEDADVIIHEYGHAVNYDINPSWGGGQEGAMGEGTGDYLAGSYSYSRYPLYQADPPFVFNWDGHNEFWPGRQLVDTSLHYPEDATGDIYIGGTLWCSANYQAMMQIGRSVMDALFLDHQFSLGSSATMEDAANAVLQSDIDMFGGVHIQALVQIYDFWGMLDASQFVPTISHTPLGDTEDVIGPYVVTANITSVQPLNPASLLLYWGTGAGFPNSVLLTATGNPNEYSASLPGQPGGTDVRYYLTASDTQGGTATHPAGAPGNYHQFHVGPDVTPPVIVHTEMRDQALMRWPASVRATVTDNLGVASVVVEWMKNSAPMTPFALSRIGSTNDWEGLFNTTQAEMAVGDYVEYKIVATDNSSQMNQTLSPPSGYWDFNIIDVLGVVLVITDDDGLKAPDSPKGPSDEPNPAKVGESATQMVAHLTSLGYLVDTQQSATFDDDMWSGYDFIVSASGNDQGPVSNAAYRTALEAYVAAGGKLLVEGGEVGYDAISSPGYPTFAANVLHAVDWDSDNAGALNIATGYTGHPLYTTPNQLPSSMTIAYTGYGDEDANLPAADAYRVYGTTSYPNDAGILVYDDNPNPVSAQIVFFNFNFAALADQATRNNLIENTAEYFLAVESAPTGGVSGHCDLTDTGDDSGVTVELQGPASSSVVTGPDGYYEFLGLYPGSYTVTAHKTGYYPYSLTTPVAVAATVVTDVDFAFDPIALGTIAGTVTLTNNPDASGVTVSVDSQGISDVTGPDGVYLLSGLMPGDLKVSARKDGYVSGVEDVVLPNGGGLTGVDFLLAPGSNEFFSDFEADNGGFTPTPATGGWEWGTPTVSPSAAYSGVKCWATILAGNYVSSCNYILDTPPLDLGGFTNAVLEFQSWYDTEAYYDGGNIKVSTDGGATWTIVTPIGGYPEDAAYTGNAAIPGEPCFSGHIQGFWELVQVDLGAYAGDTVIIRFHFGSDSSINYSGWSIDDVRVKDDIVKLVPENLTAQGGLENHVPLAWDPVPKTRMIVYGQTSRMDPLQRDSEVLKTAAIPAYQQGELPEATMAEGYWVYRSGTAGGPYTRISTLIGLTAYDDTDVVNGTPYYYVVTADYGSYGESGFSNEATATPMNNPPAPPENLTASWMGATAALNWDDNTDYDLAGYKVYKSYNYEPFAYIATTTLSQYTDALGADGVYRYRVTAFDLGAAESAPSNMASLLVGFLPPENLQAQSGYDGHVPLTWQHPGSGVSPTTLNILLVSDQTDGATTPEIYDEVYTTAFEEYGVSYTVWNHDAQGEPSLADLEPYNVIFWITGVSGGYAASETAGHVTLTLAEEATLVQWLEQGDKNLVLGGIWIAWNCVADAQNQVQYPSELFDDYMQINYPSDNFASTGWIQPDNTWVLAGQGGAIGGTANWPINWVSAESYPDMLEPATGTAAPIFLWQDGADDTHHAAGIQTDGGSFKTVMLSCPVEQIGATQDVKNLLVANILNWFTGLSRVVEWKLPPGAGGNAVMADGHSAAPRVGDNPVLNHGNTRYRGTGKPERTYRAIPPGYYNVLNHFYAVCDYTRMTYSIFRTLTSPVGATPENMIAWVGPDVTGYDDWGPGHAGLTNGVTYHYVVVADYDGGTSPPSNEAIGTPVNLPPAPPTDLVATVVGTDVQLEWGDNTEYDFASYSVDRQPNGGAWTEIASGLTSSDHVDVPGSGIWKYRVRAVDTGNLSSDPSDDVTALVGALPPSTLVARSNYDGYVPLNWMPPGTQPEYEIAYDDGSGENGIALNTAGNGTAVRVTPLGYPAVLGKVRFFISSYSAPTTPYYVRVYDDDGPGGVGGTLLAQAETQAEAGDTWVEVDFTAEGISFTEGDFYIAMIWIVGANPGPTCYVGLDENGSFEDRSWLVLDSGATWSQDELHQYFPNSEFMMRCTVYGPSLAAIEQAAPIATANMPLYDLKTDGKPYEITGTASLALKEPTSFDRHQNSTEQGTYYSFLWDPSEPIATEPVGYRIYRALAPGVPVDPAHLIADLGNVQQHTDSDVVNGTEYFYVATAVYPGEESGPSNEDSAIPMDVLAPAAVTNLQGAAQTTNAVLTWTDPALNTDGSPCDDLAGLRVYRDGALIGTAPAGAQTYTDVNPGTGTFQYYVRAYDEVPNVGPQSNVVQVLVGAPGYQNNFETDSGGYTVEGGVWAWGTPSGTGAPSPVAHSGTKCWETVLTGNYPNNANAKLTMIPITIYDNTTLQFWHWYITESYYDGGNVKISTDNGTTWTLVTPTTGYPEDAAYSGNAGIPGQACFSGSQSTWTQVTFNLGAYGTPTGRPVLIRFHFGSDSSVTRRGWCIDDIVIWNAHQKSVDAPDDVTIVPPSADLLQNSPNPFNPRTEIRFGVPATGPVRLAVYNLQGQLVRTLVDGIRPAGYDAVVWDGMSDSGESVSSGVYLYRIETAKGTVTRKMMLLK
jgi:Zn-dependent metalloprotease